jgi:hypothetical protein
MHLPAAARSRAPYGLAFPVHELVHVRTWAAQGGVRLRIALDQVLDGAEFEELLFIVSPDRRRRALSVWRTKAGIVAQASNGKPLLFSSANAVMVHYTDLFSAASASRGSFWRQLLLR